MVFCLFCPAPVNRDTIDKSSRNENYGKFVDNQEKFDITMCQAPCKEPLCCFISFLPLTCLISHIKMRYKVLNHINPGSGWDDYICCQGHYGGCCCIQPGKIPGEDSCAPCCMCLEATCCTGLSVSATKFTMMEKYNLGLDDGDARLIHCNNCLQLAVCIARCVNICVDAPLVDACECGLEAIACIFFQCISGCMLAQVNRECDLRDGTKAAPSVKEMER